DTAYRVAAAEQPALQRAVTGERTIEEPALELRAERRRRIFDPALSRQKAQAPPRRRFRQRLGRARARAWAPLQPIRPAFGALRISARSSPVLAWTRDSGRRRRRVLDHVTPARGEPRVPGVVVLAFDLDQAAIAEIAEFAAQRVERKREPDIGQHAPHYRLRHRNWPAGIEYAQSRFLALFLLQIHRVHVLHRPCSAWLERGGLSSGHAFLDFSDLGPQLGAHRVELGVERARETDPVLAPHVFQGQLRLQPHHLALDLVRELLGRHAF